MLALIDATGMYASAEKVFDPTIRDKPVIVLSNNDGCIVAMCPIAKRLEEVQSSLRAFVNEAILIACLTCA
ncbi:Y-family DNA polymerase [Salinimonas iocasae]|uniref:Y-family DNA polymerase n=1 Tax=Salinimonas iocasae TaxID=2572577 RepID=UPI0026D24C0C